jgi:hypothetical protein
MMGFTIGYNREGNRLDPACEGICIPQWPNANFLLLPEAGIVVFEFAVFDLQRPQPPISTSTLTVRE